MLLACRGITRHTARKMRSKRGMTLIEVMVAALILLIAMAGIVPLFMTGLSQASTIRLRSIATNVAREKMERIRQLDYREIYTEAMKASDTTLGSRTLESLFGTTETVRDSTFNITYVVNDQTYQDGTLKEVTVNVGWTAPPQVSPASVTTLVHQQFLGPRGANLDITDLQADPLDSPFSLITGSPHAKFCIAQADWGLIFYDPSQASPSMRNVYMRLALFDDHGHTIPIGPSGSDYKIGTSYIQYTRDAGGAIDAVWFEYPFEISAIPDGYWEIRAVAYNEYNEPGNTWRRRVRIEQGAPLVPTGFTATPQNDNHTIVLNWSSGSERDREYYVLQRRTWDYATSTWFPWVTVVEQLDPSVSSYTDIGNPGAGLDPWGSPSAPNYYEYSLWAVDICEPGLAGPAVQTATYIPLPNTPTTIEATTTTIEATTTTTAAGPTTTVLYTATIKNTSTRTTTRISMTTSSSIRESPAWPRTPRRSFEAKPCGEVARAGGGARMSVS